MARFVLLAGKYITGKQSEGTRRIVKPNEAFDTYTEKQTAYCRKYPENFQEVAGPLPVFSGKVVDIHGSKPTEPVEETITVDMDELRAMNVRDLLMFARKHGISVKSTKKEDVLKTIEESLTTAE